MSLATQSPDIKRLVDWIKENTMPEQFDSLSEYMRDVKNNVDQLENNHPFWSYAKPILRKFYEENNPNGEMDLGRRHTEANQGTKKYGVDHDFKENRIWTPKEFADNYGYNKNTTKRVFQELAKEGVLEKTSRGHYRIKEYEG